MIDLVTQSLPAVAVLSAIGLAAVAVQCRDFLKRTFAAHLPRNVKEMLRILLDADADWNDFTVALAKVILEVIKELVRHFRRRPSELILLAWLAHELSLTDERWTSLMQ